MSHRFRARSEEIEAIQWTRDNQAELEHWFGRHYFSLRQTPVSYRIEFHSRPSLGYYNCVTLDANWWAVRRTNGKVSSMTDSEFRRRYEPILLATD